jgi:hypothetical protein
MKVKSVKYILIRKKKVIIDSRMASDVKFKFIITLHIDSLSIYFMNFILKGVVG